MNKEYTYIDGKVIIRDKYGRKTQDKYYDKIEEVLIQENLIETMEKKMQVLEDVSQYHKKNDKKHYIPNSPLILFLANVCFIIILELLEKGAAFSDSINTIFGTMSQGMAIIVCTNIISIPLLSFYEFMNYGSYRSLKKRKKGIDSKLEYLKKQLEEEKEKLNELKKDKTRVNENNEFRTVLVDDTQKLGKLNDDLNFHFDLGYNSDKYYKYYEKGKIDEKLKNYTDDEIEVVKEYLEEKSSTLVKKRKRLLKDKKY